MHIRGDIPHSVTQSSFQEPCTYLTANSSAGTGAGFDSGLTNAVQFTINVTDDQRMSSLLYRIFTVFNKINMLSLMFAHEQRKSSLYLARLLIDLHSILPL